jgi:cytochrome c oxidase assembly protein subunit 11
MANNLGTLNKQILLKLLLLAVLMFGFGYALVPLYKALCEVTGINVITSKNNYGVRAHGASKPGNTQIDYSRTVTIEFDSNSRGPFAFKPVKNFLEVHPGELHEIVYEVVNTKDRAIAAQAGIVFYGHTFADGITQAEMYTFCAGLKTRMAAGTIECMTFPQFCQAYS